MAELAHDASGPPSSEPAGITQQVKQPTSSNGGKLRVFISYSRDDLYFANQLDAALRAYGFECFIDRKGISGGEEWKRRLGNLIRDADTVVFVLSPTSARSEICAWEVEEAARLNKRILPVNCRPLDGVSPPSRLRDLNYIFFYADPKVLDSGFGAGLLSLVEALNTDFDWLREHTRYLQRAIEWDTGGRPANRLLSGNDIREAKAWAARRPKSAPEPTALQLDYIRASEVEAEVRLSEQRKQLDAMAAAQAEREKALHDAEEALKQAADAQRRRTRIRNIALASVSGLAAIAVLLALLANQQRITAEKQRQQADTILARATTIIGMFWYQMDSETNPEAFALFQAGAEHGDATAMYYLGVSYKNGLGVPQDYAKAREWLEKALARGDASAKLSLEELPIREAETAGRYAEALPLEEALAAKVETDETKRQGKPGTETARQLNQVVWDALFAKEFTKALTVADRSHALFPNDLSIEPNRAHALMFMRHDEEAKALYLVHKGEVVKQYNKLWERLIAEDYTEFREAGLTHPMMADIEKELGISR